MKHLVVLLTLFCLKSVKATYWLEYTYLKPDLWEHIAPYYKIKNLCYTKKDLESCRKYEEKMQIFEPYVIGKKQKLYNFLHEQCNLRVKNIDEISEISNFLSFKSLKPNCIAELQQRERELKYLNQTL